jgi:hypothetical protein
MRQAALFDEGDTGTPAALDRSARKASRPKLTPAEAANLYRQGMSACEIAAAHGITRQGAEARIRAGGLGGVCWCPIHRTHEELRLDDPRAPLNAGSMWGAVDALEWREPIIGAR